MNAIAQLQKKVDLPEPTLRQAWTMLSQEFDWFTYEEGVMTDYLIQMLGIRRSDSQTIVHEFVAMLEEEERVDEG